MSVSNVFNDSNDPVPYYYDVMNVPVHDESSTGYLIHEVKPSNNNQSGLNNESSTTITFQYILETVKFIDYIRIDVVSEFKLLSELKVQRLMVIQKMTPKMLTLP